MEHLRRYDGEDFEKISRVLAPELPVSEVSLDKEDISGLDLSALKAEVNRCLNCGCDGVNPSDLAPAPDGRTRRTDDFRWLHGEFTMVASSEVGATW